MLIETSNNKIPPESELGTSLDVFEHDTTGNGHVSRNIRLSLLACDVVQPYLSIVGVNELTMSDDIVPTIMQHGRTCQYTKTVIVPESKKDILVRWTVGGSFTIDSTELWYAKWDDVPREVLNCLDQPKRSDIEKYFSKAQITRLESNSGTGFFSKNGPSPIAVPSGEMSQVREALGPVFEASIDLSEESMTNEKLVVVASARVDQSWTNQPADHKPEVPPQSHIVNARTNPEWHHESAGKIIEGRLDWFSAPLTIVVGEYSDSDGNYMKGSQLGTVEVSNRFNETTGGMRGGISPRTSGQESSSKSGGFTFLHALLFLAAATGVYFVWGQFSSKRRRRVPVSTAEYLNEFTEEDDEFGMPNHYSDRPQNESDRGVELNKIS